MNPTLLEAAQRALIQRLREHDDPRLYREADELMSEAADALAALANEPQACRSVPCKCERQGGLSSIHEPQAEPVEQPGAVGLSERRAYEAWAEANWDLKGADPFSLVGELFPAFQAGRASIASAQPVAPGWKPIETAPKDMGTYLFLCNGVVLQGFRDATGALCVCLEAGASGHPPWRSMRRAPTHWQPIPPAATQGAKT